MLMLAAVVLSWIPVIGWIISIALFIFWIMGIVAAASGKQKPIPILGKPSQQWFKGL